MNPGVNGLAHRIKQSQATWMERWERSKNSASKLIYQTVPVAGKFLVALLEPNGRSSSPLLP